jgi:hypothetical protein
VKGRDDFKSKRFLPALNAFDDLEELIRWMRNSEGKSAAVLPGLIGQTKNAGK